jgi:hypothetical protein
MRRAPDEDAIESRLIVRKRGDLDKFSFYFLSISHQPSASHATLIRV